MAFDLKAYFARIRFDGSAAADLKTLRQLHLLHACAIPFENLDALLGRKIYLDDEGIFSKLVSAGRGGYCFEQNGLFRRALQEIGYETEDLAARVVLMRPPQMPARTHRLQLVTLGQERWLTDVGFGGKTLTAPLRFALDVEQATPHGLYKITRADADFLLSKREADEWLPMYRFDLQRQYFSDYEAANHYVATWPESHFRHHLAVCLHMTDGSSVTLGDNQLTLDGEKQMLADSASIYQALHAHLGIRLDDPVHGIDFESFNRTFRC
jgi:N-hydroxyarylamine O-acetyltransferase